MGINGSNGPRAVYVRELEGMWFSLRELADYLALEPVEVAQLFAPLIDSHTTISIDGDLFVGGPASIVREITTAYEKYRAAPDYGTSFHDYAGSPDAKPHVFIMTTWGDNILDFRDRIAAIEARQSNFPKSFKLATTLLQQGFITVEHEFVRIVEEQEINIQAFSIEGADWENHKMLLVDTSRFDIMMIPYTQSFSTDEAKFTLGGWFKVASDYVAEGNSAYYLRAKQR
jgi:hypothetical protein